ncbi:beta-lactamase family protein [Leucobacter coleopterorum]|uniref:Beta-lactamase family protein n=1 Tax=Leucobacter coleopterorum TaxID=2714933 RepID=A0ABX6JZ69_9MICO|nr:beta-lactamase family protein [Leucobacter coleopterorum]
MFSKSTRRARFATLGVLAVAALGLSACTSSGSSTPTVDANTIDSSLASSIDDAIATAMKQSGSTEAIIGVWGNDGTEYVRGYGSNKIGGNSPIRAAQAAQPVMCALLMDMAGSGKPALDREISKDLTRQVGIDGVTYGELCTMTSGIADFKTGFADIFTNNPTRVWPEQELIAQGLVDTPPTKPDAEPTFRQSDTNAVLLSRVLRVKTGEETQQLLSDHVFDKADMGSSYFPDPDDDTLSDSAMTGLTYPSSGGKPVCDADVVKVPKVSTSMLAGAGGTVTTVSDLKTFYTHFFDGTFGGEKMSAVTKETIPTEKVKAGEEPATPDPNERLWAFGMEKQGPLYGRAGAITGTLTTAFHDPDSGYTVIVALNNSSAGAAFVKALGFEIAALSANAGIAPDMTWSAEDQTALLEKGAICQ